MNRFQAMLDDLRDEHDDDLRRDRQAEARRFLATLDPDSSLGMWFDAVASSFPTRLDAALAYVEAMDPGRAGAPSKL